MPIVTTPAGALHYRTFGPADAEDQRLGFPRHEVLAGVVSRNLRRGRSLRYGPPA